MCRQAGVTRAATIEEAFEAAATFATQPLPRGPRVAVLTTAGGWGVVTADAIVADRNPRARRAARRPARRDRREAAAALEPQQPDRPRGRRDARHDPRGDGARRAPPRRRRDRVPRARHPVEPGPADARRTRSIPTTASNGSSTTTSARTRASRRPRPRCPTTTGKPILTATELAVAAPDNAGPGDGARDGPRSAIRPRTARSPRSRTCGGTPATARATASIDAPRRRTALRIGAAVLLALAALSRASSPARARRARPPTGAANADRRNRVDTALLSARRVPVRVRRRARARSAREHRLRAGCSRRTTRASPSTTPREPGAHMASRATPTVPLAPASTLKLLTGAAALAALGPEHTLHDACAPRRRRQRCTSSAAATRCSTTPAYEQAIRERSTARATDPITPLAALADAIVASGVRSVPTIVADDSRHDDAALPPDWKPSYTDDVGALGALTVDDGPPRRAAGRRSRAQRRRTARRRCSPSAASRSAAIARGTAPAEAPARSRRSTSPPLADIVAAHDHLERQPHRRDARRARSASRAAATGRPRPARRRDRDVLAELGVPTDGLDLADGSGLAPDESRHVRRRMLDTLALVDDARFAALDAGSPVAGRTGTLADRLRGDPLDRRAAREDRLHRRRRRTGGRSSTTTSTCGSRSSPTTTFSTDGRSRRSPIRSRAWSGRTRRLRTGRGRACALTSRRDSAVPVRVPRCCRRLRRRLAAGRGDSLIARSRGGAGGRQPARDDQGTEGPGRRLREAGDDRSAQGHRPLRRLRRRAARSSSASASSSSRWRRCARSQTETGDAFDDWRSFLPYLIVVVLLLDPRCDLRTSRHADARTKPRAE